MIFSYGQYNAYLYKRRRAGNSEIPRFSGKRYTCSGHTSASQLNYPGRGAAGYVMFLWNDQVNLTGNFTGLGLLKMNLALLSA